MPFRKKNPGRLFFMITALRLENFRCFRNFFIPSLEKTVFLTGSNGQGKTSVLESIFFLANLRSFRTLRTSEMIRTGACSFRISADVRLSSYTERYDIEQSEKRSLRIAGKNIARASDFADSFRTVAFLPDDPLILTGASQMRRRFFDMFISMMDRDYFRFLQKYLTALKSRNAVLRTPGGFQRENLEAWDDLLSEYGSRIVTERERYSALLGDFMRNILLEIRPELSDFQIRMRTGKGSSEKDSYKKRLDSFLVRDQRAGFTCFGPHADDFDFVADEKVLRIYGSRGQCRIVSFVMKLAELDLIASDSMRSIVLVDDAVGDLDFRAKEAFFHRLDRAGQIFHASTEPAGSVFTSGSSVQTIVVSPIHQ